MWIQWVAALIGGLGIGSILTKIIDVIWLQKVLEQRDYRSWLRGKRFEAFSSLSKKILSLGLGEGMKTDAWDMLALSASSNLLLTNRQLAKRIRIFIIKLQRYDEFTQTNSSLEVIVEVEGEEIRRGDLNIIALQKEGNKIVEDLAKELQNAI